MTFAVISSMNPALLAAGTGAIPFPVREIGGHEFVEIPEGPFVMGSTAVYNAPPHWVDLSSFLMGRASVTAEQYRSRIETNNSNIMELPSKHVVSNVSWHDAIAYSEVLSRETQRAISLPTEAQWEKGERGPAIDLREQMEKDEGRYRVDDLADWVNSELRFENFVTKLELGARIFTNPKEGYLQDLLRNGSPIFAWRVHGTSSGRLTRADIHYRNLKPDQIDWDDPANAYGLKGMTGGVWDWVLDWYNPDAYRKGASPVYGESDEPYRSSSSQTTLVRINPVGPRGGYKRCIRGASRLDNSKGGRAALRNKVDPRYSTWDLGFRVAAPCQ